MTTSTPARHAAYRLGHAAEAQAAEYLQAQGYRILALRWQSGAGEIDILASNAVDRLIVVEVKARKHTEDGLYSLTPAKQKRLTRAALAALSRSTEFSGLLPPERLNIRFDAVIITPDHPPHHLANAWQAE